MGVFMLTRLSDFALIIGGCGFIALELDSWQIGIGIFVIAIALYNRERVKS